MIENLKDDSIWTAKKRKFAERRKRMNLLVFIKGNSILFVIYSSNVDSRLSELTQPSNLKGQVLSGSLRWTPTAQNLHSGSIKQLNTLRFVKYVDNPNYL